METDHEPSVPLQRHADLQVDDLQHIEGAQPIDRQTLHGLVVDADWQIGTDDFPDVPLGVAHGGRSHGSQVREEPADLILGKVVGAGRGPLGQRGDGHDGIFRLGFAVHALPNVPLEAKRTSRRSRPQPLGQDYHR